MNSDVLEYELVDIVFDQLYELLDDDVACRVCEDAPADSEAYI